ncbi:MAG: PDZ domain-containing protein [Micromonosporaceae bacterium]|nr:PDZ domain-containing protein [Micromonosporaceae bacterium]
MRRRGATLLTGTVLLIVLIALAWQVRVPYVELGPGPTWDTLGKDSGKDVIQISGTPTSKSAGQLRMVTVGVTPDISLWEAIRGWLSGDDAVVPREVIYPPDQTQQQVDQANQQDFKNSQSSAETAALRELGYPVQVVVSKVVAGLPAVGHLQAGDVVTSVDGKPVTSSQNLVDQVRAQKPGAILTIGYTRGGVPGTTSITSDKADDGTARIGIQLDQRQPHPFKITITLNDVGGPSAGLMFSLGIIDKVKPEDLTGGEHIAGTGTIDDDGHVGPIGGIAQKLRAAKRDSATIFLVPSDNCPEAVANAVPGLEMVKVGTLDEALSALQTLRSGGTPTLCPAH